MSRVPDQPREDLAESPGGQPLLVVTPWYPTADRPYLGTFVRQSVRAVAPHVGAVTIIHVESRPPGSTEAPRWEQSPEGRVRWVPVPLPEGTGRGATVLAHRRALAAHAGDLLHRASLVHCHVGSPSAAALAPLLPTAARLVVTEHATYLPSVFRDPIARREYQAALRRAQRFTAVSAQTAAQIEASFPLESAVPTIANPVDLAGLPQPATDRSRPAAELTRWLYVGNLVPHKGVRRLVRAFAAWQAETGNPAARLTVAGDGPLRAELAELAARLGVGEQVAFLGPVAPDRIGDLYRGHDLLVHLSHVETFGLTCVEAAASGLAVVVTDCGAPTDTLALHAALGLAEVVPVADDDEVHDVVAAVHRLAAGLRVAPVPDQLQASRRQLEHCYGSAAIGAHLAAALGLPPVGGPTDPRCAPVEAPGRPAGFPVLVVVALTDGQLATAERTLMDVHDLGGIGHLVATRAPKHPLPPGSMLHLLPSPASADSGWEPRARAATKRWTVAGLDVLDAAARATAGLVPDARQSQRVLLGLGRRIDRLRARVARSWDAAGHAAPRLSPAVPARQAPQVRRLLLGLDLAAIDLVQAPTDLGEALAPVLATWPAAQVRTLWARRELAQWWVRQAGL